MNKNFNIETSKFSFCIMNPPYGRTLPFEMLKKTNIFCNTTVYIGPIGKIRSIIESNELTDYINEHCKNYEVLDNFDELFNITQRETSGILVLDQNIREKIYRYNDLYSIYKKIKAKKLKSLRTICIHKKTKYSIPLQGDNGYAKGWHLTPSQIHTAKKDTIAQLDFKSENEKNNYLKSLKCWPYKLIYLLDDNSAVQAHLPWMNDYTKEWTDERFFDYFNISKNEQIIIKNTLKNINID